MDLETRLINNIMVPYAVGIYDGNESFSFFITDYKNPDEMMIDAIEHLMKRKYHNYKVYFHNFSNFDGIFLLKILTSLSDKINIIIRDGRILDIKFKFATKNYVLYFRDSYLLLPSSLKDLAFNFNVKNKGLFPYKFVNEKNLNSKGSVPNINYFEDNIKLDEYNEYKTKFIYDN
jgi:DNA polymerase type B, organellar and viral